MAALPSRPEPPVSLTARLLRWVQWVGPSRVAGAAVSAVAVVVLGVWLVRPARPATESLLPVAATPSSSSAGAPVATVAPSVAPDGEGVVVHVAGAVIQSGVRTLPAGARVVDAVAAAGGAAPDADLDGLNLAAPLRDGQQVYVPRVGEVVPVGGSSGPTGPLDLNAATADELEALPGIGPSLAAAIVAHREQHGPFASVDELTEVPGIGTATVESLRESVGV